jgi:hypothetical protein
MWGHYMGRFVLTNFGRRCKGRRCMGRFVLTNFVVGLSVCVIGFVVVEGLSVFVIGFVVVEIGHAVVLGNRSGLSGGM